MHFTASPTQLILHTDLPGGRTYARILIPLAEIYSRFFFCGHVRQRLSHEIIQKH